GRSVDAGTGTTTADAAVAYGAARRQTQRHEIGAGDIGRALDGHRHAGTVLRGARRRQPLAARVQRPRSRTRYAFSIWGHGVDTAGIDEVVGGGARCAAARLADGIMSPYVGVFGRGRRGA